MLKVLWKKSIKMPRGKGKEIERQGVNQNGNEFTVYSDGSFRYKWVKQKISPYAAITQKRANFFLLLSETSIMKLARPSLTSTTLQKVMLSFVKMDLMDTTSMKINAKDFVIIPQIKNP